jgi:hypothetical protein
VRAVPAVDHAKGDENKKIVTQRGRGDGDRALLTFISKHRNELKSTIPKATLYKLVAWSHLPNKPAIAHLTEYRHFVRFLAGANVPDKLIRNATLKHDLDQYK